MILSSSSNVAMERAFGALWDRQQIINHNIANEDTPGYKARRLEFETYLRSEIEALRTESPTRREAISRLESVKSSQYALEGLNGRADGNNVVVDNEFVEMARTQIQYNALQQRINGHYTMLKYVINGGR